MASRERASPGCTSRSPGLVGRAIRVQEDARRFRVAVEAACAGIDDVGVTAGEDESFACQSDRRRHHLGARQGAVALQGRFKPEHSPGYGHRAIAVNAGATDWIAIRAQVHVRGRRQGRGLAEVQEDVGCGFGEVNHHEATAADVSTAGIGHGLGISHRDSGIDRIATLLENFNTDIRCQMLRRNDHAMGRFQRRFCRTQGGAHWPAGRWPARRGSSRRTVFETKGVPIIWRSTISQRHRERGCPRHCRASAAARLMRPARRQVVSYRGETMGRGQPFRDIRVPSMRPGYRPD